LLVQVLAPVAMGSFGNNAVRRYAAVDGEVVRLPKAVAMFASRACRCSKMIGDALAEKETYAIVHKLESVVDPSKSSRR